MEVNARRKKKTLRRMRLFASDLVSGTVGKDSRYSQNGEAFPSRMVELESDKPILNTMGENRRKAHRNRLLLMECWDD